MATITINERTSKGKSLMEFLRKFEGEGFIEIEKEPTASLLEAIDEIKTGKIKECIDTKDLLLWIKNEDQKTITLVDTGTHSDLFK
jgi:hypothetical protein